MKTATFLMLIKGKVFIPSLKTLQHIDPVEALLPIRIYPDASLIDEVLISPHIHLEEAIAIRDVILEICPLVEQQIKISSLLYSGQPETREMMWELSRDIEHPDMPDRTERSP